MDMPRNKQQTMNRLLVAASETIVAHGVGQINSTAVATQAGINKNLVYRYFRGWNGLLEALFAQLLSEVNLVTDTRPATGRIDALVAQETYLFAFSQLISTNPAFWVLLRWQVDHSETVLAQSLTKLLNESMEEVAGSDAADVDMLRLLIAGVTCLAPVQSNVHESTKRVIRHLFGQLRSARQISEIMSVPNDTYSETVFAH